MFEKSRGCASGRWGERERDRELRILITLKVSNYWDDGLGSRVSFALNPFNFENQSNGLCGLCTNKVISVFSMQLSLHSFMCCTMAT